MLVSILNVQITSELRSEVLYSSTPLYSYEALFGISLPAKAVKKV